MVNYSPGLTAELNDLIDGEFNTPHFRKRARQVLISVAEEMAQQMLRRCLQKASSQHINLDDRKGCKSCEAIVMTNLTNKSCYSLLRSVAKVLVEDAEGERDRASQSLYDRMQAIEFQKILDEIIMICSNGSNTPQARLEAVRDFIRELYPYPDDDDYEGEDEDEVEVDGQSQVTYGNKSPVDTNPTTS